MPMIKPLELAKLKHEQKELYKQRRKQMSTLVPGGNSAVSNEEVQMIDTS